MNKTSISLLMTLILVKNSNFQSGGDLGRGGERGDAGVPEWGGGHTAV